MNSYFTPLDKKIIPILYNRSMKLGIIVDSSIGISIKKAEKLGFGYLPLFITINGQEYKDGIDLSIEEYYKLLTDKSEVRTSATPPGIAENMFKDFSKRFDHVIVLPLSQNLSSQTQNLTMIAKEFNNIHVLSSMSVGPIIEKQVLAILEFSKNEEDINEIIEYGNRISKSSYGIVVPWNLKFLVKGGRVGPKAAAMANMLKIFPLIEYRGGALESVGKGRTFNKTVQKAALKVMKNDKKSHYYIYSSNSDYAQELKEFVANHGIDATIVDFPPVITNHTGPGALGIIKYKD